MWRLEGLLDVPGDVDPYAERILAAARAAFVRNGLRRTSLDDIAREAKVSRATLFRRFPNRVALLTALGVRESRAIIAAVDEQVATIREPDELVLVSVRAVVQQLTGNTLLRALMQSDPEVVLQAAAEQGGFVLDMGRQYIAAQLARLPWTWPEPSPELELIAEVLARLVLSFALNPRSVLDLTDDEAVDRVVRTTVLPILQFFGPAG
jgi:AcrR family transcriptional regulator